MTDENRTCLVENRTYLVDEDRTYYVWQSDERAVEAIRGTSAKDAAHLFAMRHNIPYNIALRVVDVGHVQSFSASVLQSS